ncbi:MADCA protein, partial [Penelope pileata]|nr:MADCA protein [Penelope pileata]
MDLAPLLLLLSLLGGCSGRPTNMLVVAPRDPVVPFGGSVQLNCSLLCPGGTVEWKGLDTNLGSIDTFPTHSILRISDAKVATEGTKICLGTCSKNLYQQTTILHVYSLPDALQLDVDPPVLVPGQPAHLRCSAQRVHPLMGLELTLYGGDQVLKKGDDFDATETDEELFDIVTTLQVAGEDVEEGVVFRCELTVSVGPQTFTRVASVAVRAGMEQLLAVATSTESPSTATTTTGILSTAGPTAITVPSPEPSIPSTAPNAASQEPETTFEHTAAAGSPKTEHPQGPTVGTALLHPHTTSTPSPGTVIPTTGDPTEAQGTAADGSSQGSQATTPACSLQIWSLPPNGTRGRALRIECRARCTQNATVRWLHTPVALSQYREEAMGSGSTLQLDHAEPQHQGHYQCVLLGQQSQAASLQLVVSDDALSSVPATATGTTMSLLGLIATGAISYRLWKRFRSHYDLS